jgi:putative ABC transport system substrate-binding protein
MHSARHKVMSLAGFTRMVSGFLALVVVILPIVSEAQVVGRTPRLCFVTFDRRDRDERFKPFFDGLRGLGYTDGQTITIDYLPADGAAERFPALAAECLHREADIIVVTTTPAAQAAKNATHTVPIVMVPLGDPVGTGLVASLARPGGNVTGLSFMAAGIAAKRLQLLKEAVPTIARVLVLSYLVDPIARPQVTELENAAHTKRGRKIVGGPDFPDDQFYSQRRGNGAVNYWGGCLLRTRRAIYLVEDPP